MYREKKKKKKAFYYYLLVQGLFFVCISKNNIKKIYHVGLDKPLTKADFEKIVQGVTLEDGLAFVDALGYVETNDKTQVGIEIHSGKNRIVRRIFES